MQQKYDLTGQTFGRLKVIQFAGKSTDRQYLWECECSCENHTHLIVKAGNLRSGNTKSCGCLHSEITSKVHTTHGHRHDKIYGVWKTMKSRCYNPNVECYNRYGGRRITICDEWLNSFEAFYKWSVKNGYQEGLTIDRINNDGNYEPNNCRWTDRIVQANNRRTNRKLEYKEITQNLSEWNESTNLPVDLRLRRGWDLDRAMNEPKNANYHYLTYNNKTQNLSQWCKELNLPYDIVYNRIVHLKWSVENAFETPIKHTQATKNLDNQ